MHVVNQGLSEKEVIGAQNGWCDALINISKTHKGVKEARKLAKNVIDANKKDIHTLKNMRYINWNEILLQYLY